MSSELIQSRLIKLRGNRTQTEVAEAVGVAPSAIANYESGLRVPRDDVKLRLAKYYGVSVEEIFYNGVYTDSAI